MLLTGTILYFCFALSLHWLCSERKLWQIFFPPKNLHDTSQELSLSILIPIFNEAENIPDLLAEIDKQTYPAKEVIFIDGGSSDASLTELKKAHKKNHLLIKSSRGRGCQIHTGALIATGDIIFIMHADMKLEPDVFAKVHKAMNQNPRLVGGCCNTHFGSQAFKFKILRWLNILRVKTSSISFGDQGQFCLRSLAIEKNCLLPIPLMEDVELGMRLHSHGSTQIIDAQIIASTRRWQKRSLTHNALQVFILLSTYLFLRRWQKKVDYEKFYQRYYSPKKNKT